VYSEWELLEISEDIEPGDMVTVESDTGEDTLIFVKQKNQHTLVLKEVVGGKIRHFSTQSLEEIGGDYIITGKSNE
jgi:hypothetical protein